MLMRQTFFFEMEDGGGVTLNRRRHSGIRAEFDGCRRSEAPAPFSDSATTDPPSLGRPWMASGGSRTAGHDEACGGNVVCMCMLVVHLWRTQVCPKAAVLMQS